MTSDAPAQPITSGLRDHVSRSPKQADVLSVALVGGTRLLRLGLDQLLIGRGVRVAADHSTVEEFAASVQQARGDMDCDAVVLILTAAEPFEVFRRLQAALVGACRNIPLVVLSEQTSRGQVYTALRVGAKAYVSLNAEPDELVRAVQDAARNKVYLTPDAAEMLVSDVSSAARGGRALRLPGTHLSRRENEIVQLLCEGLSSREISFHLHISPKTVENHRYNIYRKCNVDSIAGLMRHAVQHGLVSL